jgi:hypothetical protein
MSKASTTKRPMSGDYDDDYEPMSPQGKSKSPTAASAKSPAGAKSPTASTPQVLSLLSYTQYILDRVH